MKRINKFLHLITFTSILILASCGASNMNTTTATGSKSESLTGGECACAATYSPVCGINSSGTTVGYDNSCIAGCYKATNLIQGTCSPSDRPVCVEEKYTHNLITVSEKNAQIGIIHGSYIQITKFTDCNK